MHVVQRKHPDNYYEDYYQQAIPIDPHFGPVQPVQSDSHPQLANASSGILSVVLILLFIFFGCCCCCFMLPLCCPDLKTCTRIQKIVLRAKRSIEKLRGANSEKSYDPLLENDEDTDEKDMRAYHSQRQKNRPKRPRTRRTRVEIPICSDRSTTICMTTDCGSTSDSADEQQGYISQELGVGRPTHPTIQRDPDIENRYQDVSRSLKNDKGNALRTHHHHSNPMRKSDEMKLFSPPPNPPRPMPNLHNNEYKAQTKSQLYDKLIKEWKYKRTQEGPPVHDSLGPAPPPRRHHPTVQNDKEVFSLEF